MLAPELEKLAAEKKGALVIVKVDTEALPELAQHFVVRSIPTLIVFRSGREVRRMSGAMSAAHIASQLGI